MSPSESATGRGLGWTEDSGPHAEVPASPRCGSPVLELAASPGLSTAERADRPPAENPPRAVCQAKCPSGPSLWAHRTWRKLPAKSRCSERGREGNAVGFRQRPGRWVRMVATSLGDDRQDRGTKALQSRGLRRVKAGSPGASQGWARPLSPVLCVCLPSWRQAVDFRVVSEPSGMQRWGPGKLQPPLSGLGAWQAGGRPVPSSE